MDKDMLERLASKTGRQTFNGPSIPSVKLDGMDKGETAGKFLMFKDKEPIDLGSKISIRILRVRKTLSGYVEEGSKGITYTSSEYDSPKTDVVALFRRVDGDSKLVAEGTPAELREKYPLKTVSVVYSLLDGELVKVKFKGASVAGDHGLYTYLDALEEAGTHAFQVSTDVSAKLVKKNRAVSYYHAVFTKGEMLDDGYEEVESNLDLIQGIIDARKKNATERTPIVVTDDTPEQMTTDEAMNILSGEDDDDAF